MFVHYSNLLAQPLPPPPELVSVERMILHYRQGAYETRPRISSSMQPARERGRINPRSASVAPTAAVNTEPRPLRKTGHEHVFDWPPQRCSGVNLLCDAYHNLSTSRTDPRICLLNARVTNWTRN